MGLGTSIKTVGSGLIGPGTFRILGEMSAGTVETPEQMGHVALRHWGKGGPRPRFGTLGHMGLGTFEALGKMVGT